MKCTPCTGQSPTCCRNQWKEIRATFTITMHLQVHETDTQSLEMAALEAIATHEEIDEITLQTHERI